MTDPDSEFLAWLELYWRWYSKQSKLWSFALNSCTTLSLLASMISIIVAVVITPDFFAGIGRWLIVMGSLLTAFSSSTLAQFKVREMKEARERGLLETERLMAYTKQKFAEFAGDRARIYRIQDEVRESIAMVEKDQLRRFTYIRLRPEEQESKTEI